MRFELAVAKGGSTTGSLGAEAEVAARRAAERATRAIIGGNEALFIERRSWQLQECAEGSETNGTYQRKRGGGVTSEFTHQPEAVSARAKKHEQIHLWSLGARLSRCRVRDSGRSEPDAGSVGVAQL